MTENGLVEMQKTYEANMQNKQVCLCTACLEKRQLLFHTVHTDASQITSFERNPSPAHGWKPFAAHTHFLGCKQTEQQQ